MPSSSAEFAGPLAQCVLGPKQTSPGSQSLFFDYLASAQRPPPFEANPAVLVRGKTSLKPHFENLY